MAGPPQGPFETPAFKPFINRWVAFVIFLCFVAIFRLSDVVYLASSRQMVGDTQLLAEDISMLGWTSFIGMTMIFPILFRLKFRFTTKGILTVVTISLITLNICFIYVRNVPILVVLAFLSGALRIWGMFESMSSIMPGITRKRDFAEFFPVVYAFVLGFIQITGFVDTYMTYRYNWQMMNFIDISLLLLICITVQVLMRHFHMGKPMPLFGIDWLGAILWSIVLGAISYVFTYGEYLEWQGWKLATGVITLMVTLTVVLLRSNWIRHPYLQYATMKFPNVYNMLVLFMLLCFLAESQMVLQNTFTSGILHFDVLNSVSLNIPQFLGVICGAIFSWKALTKLGWTYKTTTLVGFLFMTYYVAAMYFLIDPGTNIEKLYLPVFFLGFGNVTIYIAVTVYAQKVIPFQYFFQGLCLLGFIRTGIGNPVCVAFFNRAMKETTIQHMDLLGSQLNTTLPMHRMLYSVQQQATMASIKELFGICVIVGVITMALILASRYKPLIKSTWPSDWQIYRRLQKRDSCLRKET